MREVHLQAVGAAAAVAKVDLAERLGCEAVQLPLLTPAPPASSKWAMVRGQHEGQVPVPCVDGGAESGSVSGKADEFGSDVTSAEFTRQVTAVAGSE
ncbi:hypothetical protein [Streptomyces tuirus]